MAYLLETPKSRRELKELSLFHNTLLAAIKHFNQRDNDNGDVLVQNAFRRLVIIVMSSTMHPRLFADILAVIRLLQANGYPYIQKSMIKLLEDLVETYFDPMDLRRIILLQFKDLPLDGRGHLNLTYDAFCREYWVKKYPKSLNEIERLEATYSYNQASFPRADLGGFYDQYKGKSPEYILYIMWCIDQHLGIYSHETFVMWHTAIRSLGREGRYLDMEYFARILLQRVNELRRDGYDFRLDRQLAIDATLTFCLFAESQQGLRFPINVAAAYSWAVEVSKTIGDNKTWDPTSAQALEGLFEANERLRDPRFARVHAGVFDQGL
ncbi:uncharacterized protein KD926_005936 [Aspergillus affinis]|uniref:uncharacterized protein n=1 Tax=Aspergillus affinis TaxID=1070780 RepID=UPI0022FE29DF|nr:uncharacterized protein KD926_005936 [Aspergillus affinis]KAI9045991.1 hypothetical protein KD926_005936 [Aspergillus affinis]